MLGKQFGMLRQEEDSSTTVHRWNFDRGREGARRNDHRANHRYTYRGARQPRVRAVRYGRQSARGGCGDQPDKAGTRDGLAYRRYGASRLDRAIPLFQGTDRGLRGALLRHTRKPRRSRALPGSFFRYGLDAERRHVPALYDRRLPGPDCLLRLRPRGRGDGRSLRGAPGLVGSDTCRSTGQADHRRHASPAVRLRHDGNDQQRPCGRGCRIGGDITPAPAGRAPHCRSCAPSIHLSIRRHHRLCLAHNVLPIRVGDG